MIDFHTHTFMSDGALSPAEHIRRAEVAGYRCIGITDHVDFSNYADVYQSVKRMTDEENLINPNIYSIPGVEITHVNPILIAKLIRQSRGIGIPLIIVHGESPVEPVAAGTNKAAITAGADIIAHPGLISDEDVKLAADNGVYLEITAKKGHSLTNGHVFKLAKKYGAKLVLDSDGHVHTEFLSPSLKNFVLRGCGMEDADISALDKNMEELYHAIKKRIEDRAAYR